MSSTALSSLLDYLCGTLTTSNMRWVGEHLIEYANREEKEQLRPYTMKELNAMLDASEADIAAGRVIDHEEVMREWKEELAREEQEDF
jgi:predicted transcriptional regulator